MRTATKSKPDHKPAATSASFADVSDRRMRAAIEHYRASIQRAAGGEHLNATELEEVIASLAHMGLPERAWDRDVEAQRDYAVTAQRLAEEETKRPANVARLAEIVARIKSMEEELKALKQERYVLSDVEPMVRIGAQQRINELAVNHPHLFADVGEAARLRQEWRAKSSGGARASSSISTGAWER